jgi:transposase
MRLTAEVLSHRAFLRGYLRNWGIPARLLSERSMRRPGSVMSKRTTDIKTDQYRRGRPHQMLRPPTEETSVLGDVVIRDRQAVVIE